MPVSYSFDDRLFHLKGIGLYTPLELFKTFKDALDNPKFPDHAAFLFDVSQSESLGTRTVTELKNAVQAIAPHADRFCNKCAVLAKSDLNYGLSRLGTVFSEESGINTEVFRTFENTLEWLGIHRNRISKP